MMVSEMMAGAVNMKEFHGYEGISMAHTFYCLKTKIKNKT